MDRTSLFISHSTPNDNYYAAWLASKLRVLGYTVWVDLNDLRKGASFWPKIQKTIAEESVRFLAIVTKSYNEKALLDRSGVLNEIACACDIRDIEKFIIPLRFDGVPFSSFPIQFRAINSIDFANNWAGGLRDLLKHLNDEKIYPAATVYNPLDFWLASKDYHEVVIEKPDTYHSNWFELTLPEFLYFHQPKLFSDAGINELKRKMPVTLFGNKLVSFQDASSLLSVGVPVEETVTVPISSFLASRLFFVDDSTTVAEPNNLLIDLLNRSFELYALSNGLLSFEMAHGDAFYYPNTAENRAFVALPKSDKRLKKIMGVFRKDNTWLLAISHRAYLKPFPHIKIVTHILFTTTDGLFRSKEDQHALRRGFSIGTNNRDWLDFLLAFVTKLAGGEDFLTLAGIQLGGLKMRSTPFSINSDIGYIEPKSLKVASNE